ncbi:MAG: amino acid adenylation domain-containing protein [Ardenticatenaceae bacterium]|nr:amino acid adenylation domain-containing protein [Ardenticatenaceae bacterium]
MHYLLQHTIDRAAAKTPEKIAFRFDEQSLTYGQMAERTNQLAHQLVALGVKKGDRVGVYLHQSMESAIAIYGIMKAGAAYVPFDPSLPQERVAFMLQDCGVQVMISENRKLGVLEEAAVGSAMTDVIGPARESKLQIIPWTAVSSMPADGPPEIIGLNEDDLAYIMYTSGSTGTPKGMMHTHRSGLAYAKASAMVYDIQPDDVVSNHPPLHFDMSTFGLFSAPLAGATTVIIPEEYKMLPASLSELIQDEKISIWYSVPTALIDMLLRGDLDNRDWSAMRWVTYGGEIFPPGHLYALMGRLPQARFSNVYGPAEVNQCTYYHIPPLPNQYETTAVPIGRVWEVGEGLILGDDDRPVAPGEPGELLVAAPTRMQGYWNQPDLTARGFYRQRPFPNSPYEKIFYRTGDLVQEREDGELLFLGRKDRQVKIRGYRVELDEVEAAVSLHDAIAEAAVYTLTNTNNDRFIEAAVLLKENAKFDPQDLLKHAARLLPAYAAPASAVVHQTFPRTGSEKISRRKLQEMAQEKYNRDQLMEKTG